MVVEHHSVVVSRSPTLRANELEGVEKLDSSTIGAPDKLAEENVGEFEPTLSPPVPPTFSSFPDGGLKAWLQVAGSFFLIFATWCAYSVSIAVISSAHVEMTTAGETTMHSAPSRPTMKSNYYWELLLQLSAG